MFYCCSPCLCRLPRPIPCFTSEHRDHVVFNNRARADGKARRQFSAVSVEPVSLSIVLRGHGRIGDGVCGWVHSLQSNSAVQCVHSAYNVGVHSAYT